MDRTIDDSGMQVTQQLLPPDYEKRIQWFNKNLNNDDVSPLCQTRHGFICLDTFIARIIEPGLRKTLIILLNRVYTHRK
jgi:hypothetical protein